MTTPRPLKLPPPPPPPKPLHLTMSMRSKEKSNTYRALPVWDKDNEKGGTLKGVVATLPRGGEEEGEEEEDDWGTARTSSSLGITTSELPSLNDLFSGERGISLDEPVYDRKSFIRIREVSGGGENDSINGSSKKMRRKVGNRNSIFFDPMLENPFVSLVNATPSSPHLLETSILSGVENVWKEGERIEPLPSVEKEEVIQEDFTEGVDVGHDDDENEANFLDLQTSLSAISLHPFVGEAKFGELTFDRGIGLIIEVEELGGGWSLGYQRDLGEESRGLIPLGFYAYIDSPLISLPASPPPEPVAISSPSSPSPPLPSLPLPSPPLPSPPLPSTPLPSTRPLSTLTLISTPPPLSLDSSRLNDTPSSSSTLRVKSIGRSVIISGIEFEPTDVWNTLTGEEKEEEETVMMMKDEGHRRGLSIFSDGWEEEQSSEEKGNVVDKDTEKEEGLEVEKTPDNNLNLSEHLNSPVIDNQAQSAALSQEGVPEDEPFGSDEAVEETTPLSEEYEVSSLPPVVEEEDDIEAEEENGEDTQEAREDRWAAIIAQADDSHFSSILQSTLVDYNQDQASPSSLDDNEDGSIHSNTSFASSGLLNDTSLPSAPTPPLPPPALHSIFSRFSLNTVGRAYSTSSIGLGGPTSKYSTTLAGTRRKGIVLDWITNGEPRESKENDNEPDQVIFHIDTGPAWKSDSPPFFVQIYSPETRRSPETTSEYTSFQISTTFSPSFPSQLTTAAIVVERRYSHFTLLDAVLRTLYPILVFPTLPPKTLSKSFTTEFIESRRRDLERWLNRIGRHDVLRSTGEVRGFLAIENESELRRLLTENLPSTFFGSQVYYPEFNFHHSDVEDLLHRFETHTRALEVGGGIVDVEGGIGKVRETFRDTGNALSSLAHSLVRLVSGIALPSAQIPDVEEEVDSDSRRRAQNLCLQNDQGAFTWKESCDEALSLTKALQATAETISAISGLYDQSARIDLLPIQELIRESSAPYSQHAALIFTHRSALAHHLELSEMDISQELVKAQEHEDEIARCETIVNITSAELERVHKEKLEDFKWAAEEYLRTQIEFHERSLEHLKFAASHFDPSSYSSLAHTGPRLKSLLEVPTLPPLHPLTMPSNFGIPTTFSTRPVGEVLFGAVAPFLSGASSNVKRSSSRTLRGGGGGEEKTVQELLSSQAMERNSRVEDNNGRETWKESIFGTVKFWPSRW